MMHSPKQAALLLIAGFLVTLTSAVTTCPPSNITDVSACTNISPVDFVQEPCTPTIQQYACSSVSTLAALPDDFLVTLSSCYSSVTVLGLDPIYSALYFSKMDNSKINTVLSKLKIQFTSLAPEWRTFLLKGIWSVITQNLNGSADQLQWIPTDVQPFLAFVTPDMVQCAQKKNVTCATFQELVKRLDAASPNMPITKRQNLYPALKSFLMSRQNLTGSACPVSGNSSAWLQQNFGNFSQFADYNDFVALNGNFSAMEALSSLTVPQIVSCSLFPATGPGAAGNISDSIVGTLKNSTDVYNFLTSLNNAVTSKNNGSVTPQLSQALLNKTFQVIRTNFSSFNSSDWAQLFQNQLSSVLPGITTDQLSLIPNNISCNSYQAIVKGLDSNFSQMTPAKQESVYKSFVKPYLTNKGSACPVSGNSSAWLQQNFGNFSQFADYNDFVALNGNFSAMEALSSLTVPQIVSCSLFPATGPGAAGNISDSIVGTLKNSTDVYNFLTSLNNAVTSKNNGSVTPQLSQALLNKTFQVIRTNFSSFNSSDWAQLFQNQLSSVLPEITTDQMSLIPNNISCNSYQAIVKGLDSNFSQMTPAKQESVYKSFVKPYLTNKGNTITCFNQTDANSSAWLVTNMASFMTYTSEEDLALFANETMLQIFASDSSCVQLASQLKFPKNTAVYYTSLLTSSGNTNLSSVPVTFFCYLKPSALKKLNANEALAVSKKINQQCFNASSGQAASNPTSEEVQVATSLVSKLNNFSSDTIINLGQSAVGLSPSQINSISNKDLESSLSSLSNINGWTKGQSRAIMNKLLQSNFQIKNLENLGSLVSGLPSKKLQDLDPQILLNATKNAQFVNNLSSAPPALQDAFVKQITAINSTPSYIVKNVPGNLVSFIPKSLLNFNSEKPVLQDVNSKSWSADQASMFFDDVVSSTSSYSQLSASVLQGFTCGTPSKINKDQMKNLAKAMKTQNALLSEDQVNCLTRQITKDGYPTDLDTYPKEVFLFLNASNYSAGSCKDFFTNVGMANVSILPKDSKRRADLLAQSLSCMNVTGYSLTGDNIQVLGQLACDLNSSYINNSTGNLLTQLSQCKSFTADQQDSIQKAITSGNSVFGAPSTWTKSKLNSIGGISGILNKDILTKIPSVSLKTWMQESIQNSALTRNQFASIVTNISPTRSRRASSCPSGMQITADNVNNDLLPMEYNAVDLDACLDNQTLINYLEVLGNKPFTNEQLNVLKNRLDQLYPGGYPESVIPNLGAIIFMCGPNDINKWNITSVDTLGSLLAVGPTDAMAALYIGKFTSLGNPLNGSALNIIGSNYICLLTSAQLALITPSAISEAKPLDISACNQTVKDSMYAKAKLSYQGVANQTAYYSLIKPYLGGAPVADLKSLAAKNPNMDIGTFIKLNPSSVMGLSVSDVKGLLGSNTVDLVNQQSNPVVSAWIKAQKQSDLDTLGLGLQGGIRDYVYTTLSSSIATAQQPSSSAPALPRGFSIFLAAIVGILLL